MESGRAVDLNAPASFFEGALSAPIKGAVKGLLVEPARVLNLSLSPIPEAIDRALGSNTRDWWFENMMLARQAHRVTPSPNEVGTAGQLLHALFDVGSQALAAGPAGVLVSKTLGKSIEGVEEGLDVPTAGLKGLIEGGSAAAGVALPIAMKPLVGSRIPGLVQQIGYGIATNVPMGVASRALTHKVLADAGHPEMAEQYKALDEGGLLTDFVLGAAFGTLGHALQAKGGRAPHVEPADVDAALTKGNAYHLEVNTAPGLAKNAETRDAHVDAVLKATEDLMAGRAVDVSVELRAADFQPMPAIEAARTELVAQTEALARPIIEAQEETRAITEPVVASRPVGDVEAALRTHFTENPGKPVHVALAESGEVIAWSTSKKRLAEELEQTKAQATRVQRVTAATLDKLLPKPAGALAAGKAEPLGKPIEPERAQAIEQALKTEGVQATSENVATVHLIAQARELDAAAVDKIPEAASDAEYMAKVKEVISANDKTAAAHPDRESAAGEGPGAARGAARQEGAGEGQAARGPEGEARAGGEGAGRVEPLTIEHPEMRAELERMAGEAGWAEIGGRMIRKPEYEGDPNPPVIGRTKWLPKADWWPGRVGKLNEDQTREAVRKALAGEKLKKNEQAAIDYMIDVANERRAERSSIHDEEWAAIAEDVRAEGLEPTHENVVDSDLVARAAEIDEAAVERAAAQYENDDRAFLAEIERVIRDHEEKARAAADGGGEAGARPQEEGRPALELTTQSEADLRVKDAQAATGDTEERAAALRDRNEAILTPPAGTAPPRDAAAARVPTQQEGLFGAAEMRAMVEAQLRDAEDIVREAPDMLVPREDGTLAPAEDVLMQADERIAKAQVDAKAFDAAVRCATRVGG